MSQKIDYTTEIIGLILAVCLVAYIWWERNSAPIMQKIYWFMAIPWKEIGITITLSIATIFLVYYFVRRVKEKRESKEFEVRTAERVTRKKVDKLGRYLSTDFSLLTSEQSRDKLESLRDRIKLYVTDENKQRIEQFYLKIERLVRQKERDEKLIEEHRCVQEERIRKQKEKEQKIFNEQVEELYKFKKKKRSIKALPVDKKYTKDIMREAEWLMRDYVNKREEYQFKRDEAIKYYQEHDLDSKPYLKDEGEEEVYAKVREDSQTGKIQLHKKVQYFGEKLDSDFYRASELNEQDKHRALAQGFQYVRGNELDGRLCGGFYIRKGPRESKRHFCLKHLFAEVHPNMRVEYQKEDKRADMVFFIEDFSVCIEIETGANPTQNMIEKIPWLNKHFDQWLIVCLRKEFKKYNMLVDHRRSFVMTPKQAKDYILEMIAPLEHR